MCQGVLSFRSQHWGSHWEGCWGRLDSFTSYIGECGPFCFPDFPATLKAPGGRDVFLMAFQPWALTWYRASTAQWIFGALLFFFFPGRGSWPGQGQLGGRLCIILRQKQTYRGCHMMTPGFSFVVQILASLDNWTWRKGCSCALLSGNLWSQCLRKDFSLHIRKMNFRPRVEAAQSPEGPEPRAGKPVGSQEACSSLCRLIVSPSVFCRCLHCLGAPPATLLTHSSGHSFLWGSRTDGGEPLCLSPRLLWSAGSGTGMLFTQYFMW